MSIAAGIEPDRIAYEALLAGSRQRSIFAESWWLDATTGSPDAWRPNLLRAGGSDDVQAAWPLPTRSARAGLVAHGVPYTPWLGPLLPDRSPEAARWSADVDLLGRLAQQLDADYAHVEAACMPELDYWTPLSWHGFTQTTRTTWRIDAGSSVEEARAAMRSSSRKELGRAERAGLTTRAGTVDELLTACGATFERQGARLPNADVLERVARLSLERERGEVITVVDEHGAMASAGLFVWDDRFTYNLANGLLPDVSAGSAPRVLLWNAIVNALARGTGFDFEGSMLQPIEHVVRSFGGRPHAYSVVRRSSRAWERSVARKRRLKRLTGR